MKSNLDISIASDYCVAEVLNYKFYYGYEESSCEAHSNEEECYDKNCDSRRWNFVCFKDGKEIYRSDLDCDFGQLNTEDTTEYVLHGILLMMENKKIKINE